MTLEGGSQVADQRVIGTNEPSQGKIRMAELWLRVI